MQKMFLSNTHGFFLSGECKTDVESTLQQNDCFSLEKQNVWGKKGNKVSPGTSDQASTLSESWG